MKGCLCIPTGPVMAKEVATPMMKRNCISTVSCLCCAYLCLQPLPSRHLLLVPSVRPLSSGSLSLPLFSVKVPTRRTFLDPQSCGDPLQAVHLFAKELDAKSVTLEKSLGAGKPWTLEAWIHQGAPPTG